MLCPELCRTGPFVERPGHRTRGQDPTGEGHTRWLYRGQCVPGPQKPYASGLPNLFLASSADFLSICYKAPLGVTVTLFFWDPKAFQCHLKLFKAVFRLPRILWWLQRIQTPPASTVGAALREEGRGCTAGEASPCYPVGVLRY